MDVHGYEPDNVVVGIAVWLARLRFGGGMINVAFSPNRYSPYGGVD
jgi:hypothetical protein